MGMIPLGGGQMANIIGRRQFIGALCGEVETSASEEIVRLSFCGKVEIAN
jgi:hypothetical protein